MQQLQQAEQQRAAAAQAKNELEAYIISTQGRISDDEEVEAVSTDKQRNSFLTELGQVEEWLYDQGEHEQAPIFRLRSATTSCTCYRPCDYAYSVCNIASTASASLKQWCPTSLHHVVLHCSANKKQASLMRMCQNSSVSMGAAGM